MTACAAGERNREMKELHREMSDTFWPRARLLNCLALCCRAEKTRMSKAEQEAKKGKERFKQKTNLIKLNIV